MERITTWYKDKALLMCGGDKASAIGYAIDKLAEYEDLEEQGRLIKLPCKVGDTVYLIDETFNYRTQKGLKCIINEFVIDKDGTYAVLDCVEPWLHIRRWKAVTIKTFGKTVFFTREEAEAKLKEVQNG